MTIACRFSPMGGIPDRVFKATFVITGGAPLSINCGGYNFKSPIDVDWGDGTTETFPAFVAMATISHQYNSDGEYQITLKSGEGNAPYMSFLNSSQIKSVDYSRVHWFRSTQEMTACVSFQNCSSIECVDPGLMCYNANVTEFSYTFYNCVKFTQVPVGIFDNAPNATNFDSCFRQTKIISIPTGLFKNNNNATTFRSCFLGCNTITGTIPERLFNGKSRVSSFAYTFSGCTGITGVPAGLFDDCTSVSTFEYTFNSCYSIEAVPELLFKYNLSATSFSMTFVSCSKATIPENLFCDAAEKTNRFANITPNFTNCFNRGSWQGSVAGTAPDLWNYTFAGTPITVGCYGGNGNSATSLTNYVDIPAAWK